MYSDVKGLDTSWHGIQSIVRVDRSRLVKGKASSETSYYISSLPPTVDASVFYLGLRGHWGIESMHYVKDVTWQEDASKLCKGESAENMSLLRSVSLNVFRHYGSTSIARGMRLIGHNVLKLSKILMNNDMRVKI